MKSLIPNKVAVSLGVNDNKDHVISISAPLINFEKPEWTVDLTPAEAQTLGDVLTQEAARVLCKH